MVKRASRLAKPPNMSVNQDNNLQKMKRSRCCGGGDGIIRAGGQRCSLAKVQLGNPGQSVADRVRVQDESSGCVSCGPIAQPHDLEDFQSMSGCIMRPLLGGNPFTLLAEDRQLAFEQPGIAVKMVGERLGAKDR